MNILKTSICGLITLAIVLTGMVTLTASANSPQENPFDYEQPSIPKMRSFNGEVFRNFAEFRVQKSTFSTLGTISLEGYPYEQLINVNNIVKVQRFEDGDEKDFSSLMFIAEDSHPRGISAVLVREPYSDVIKRMKKAIESR